VLPSHRGLIWCHLRLSLLYARAKRRSGLHCQNAGVEVATLCSNAETTIETQVKEMVTLMLSTHTVVACERFYKRPHPGRKHLVKFPRKLTPFVRQDQTWDPGDDPLVHLCCLFPCSTPTQCARSFKCQRQQRASTCRCPTRRGVCAMCPSCAATQAHIHLCGQLSRLACVQNRFTAGWRTGRCRRGSTQWRH
jgi:hypothetical protein